jgi:hypothetical protein
MVDDLATGAGPGFGNGYLKFPMVEKAYIIDLFIDKVKIYSSDYLFFATR